MANYSIASGQIGAYEKTMTSNVVDTYTFQGDVFSIEILNHDGVAAIYARLDGVDPTVGDPASYIIPAAVTSDEFASNIVRLKRTTVVKLISSGTPKVSVMRADV